MTAPVTLLQARLPLRDPHDCTDAADELALYGAVHDTLVRRAAAGFAPRLAARWSVGADARDWTFHLRPRVQFHDGAPCDAEAARLSILRMAREDKGATLGAPAVWRQYLGGAEVAAPDPLTLRLRLAAPLADLLDILAQAWIVAPSSLAALDAGDAPHPIGCGPYRVVRASAEAIEMTAVPHYVDRPANPSLIWRAEADPARRLDVLRRGEVHLATALDFTQSDVLPAEGLTRVASLTPVAVIYLLNAARGPLADPRTRLALSLAVDRAALVREAARCAARPLHGIVGPTHFGAATAPPPALDLDRARALLAEAGHGGGLRLALDCPTRLPDEAEALTAALARQLAPLGITLDIRVHADREAYAHRVRLKQIGDLCVFDSSPFSTFRVLHEKIDGRTRGAWWQGYANPEVEARLDRARATPDDGARAALYREIHAILQRDPPWLSLYSPLRVTGLRGRHPGFALPPDAVLAAAELPALGA